MLLYLFCFIVVVAPIIIVFVVVILSFVFVYFQFFVVVVFLGSYVVKLGEAKTKTKNGKKTPQKSGRTSGYFLHDKLWLHVQKLLFYLVCFVVFALLFPKHYQNRFLMILTS